MAPKKHWFAHDVRVGDVLVDKDGGHRRVLAVDDDGVELDDGLRLTWAEAAVRSVAVFAAGAVYL